MVELLALMKPLAPTITSPTIADPHPAKWRFSITIPNSILENKAVVTILAPLNIRYVEPEMKLRPIYCSIDEKVSASAGTKK